jgi:DNA-binding MarR family transcriptional regulator
VTDQVRSFMTPELRRTAIRLGNALALLERLDKNMRLRGMWMFLLVGHNDGRLTVTELAERCGVRKTVASRYLSDLGTIDRHGKPGLGLITVVQRVYGDRRLRHVHLTERGRALIDEMRVPLTEPRPRKRF